MLHGIPSRRGTIKSIKSFIGMSDDVVFEPIESNNTVDVLYLPPTIPNLKYMSPSLWNWITNGSRVQVYSPAGELLPDQLPSHLLNPPPLPKTERPIQPRNISPTTSKIAAKQARKPVHSEELEKKYFFINVKGLQMAKVSSQQVICLIGVEDQKRSSSVVPLQKDYKNPVHYGIMNEGFLFELPRHKQQIVLSIRLYSRNGAGLTVSPSNMSISSNTSKIGGLFKMKRTPTVASNFTFVDHDHSKGPADPSLLGSFICEYSMVLPCAHPFGKLDMGYPLTYNKKEYGKVNVSMSITTEAPYSPIAEIWDKKWVIANSSGITVYSAIFGEDRSAIGYIPYKQMKQIKRAPREFMAAPNCFQLTISLPWTDDTSIFMPTQLSRTWKDQVAEAGLAKTGSMDIYVTADSQHQFEKWNEFIECHIQRYQSRR